MSATQALPQRFWDKVDRQETGCWVWTGALSSAGYGQLKVAGKVVYTHRLSYEALVGSIPGGLHIDHLCRNRACCNPDHLEPVTVGENTRRSSNTLVNGPSAVNKAKTACINGHPFTPENTYLHQGRRRCKTCMVRRTAEWRARQTKAPKEA